MRIRLSFEIRIHRDNNPTPTPDAEPPAIVQGPEALVERAGEQRIGFHIDMPDHEQ